MTPAERCANAVASGKFKSAEAWAAAVLVSTDPRVEPLKAYARQALDASVGARAWVWLLAARRDAGEKLQECQHKAIKQLIGESE